MTERTLLEKHLATWLCKCVSQAGRDPSSVHERSTPCEIVPTALMVRSVLWENCMDEGAMNNVMPVCMVLPLGCTVGLFLGVYAQ